MAVTCSACGYDKNPDGAEFCDACGSELSVAVVEPMPEPMTSDPTVISKQPENLTVTTGTMTEAPVYEPTTYEPETSEPVMPPDVYGSSTVHTSPIPSVPTSTTTSVATGVFARLIPRQVGAPVPEFVIDNGSAIVGIFDPDTGPVEIDLEGFSGDETVSRNHAEIYQEGAIWKVKDLGSTNGIFIKPAGQSRFASRIMTPTAIHDGDELAIAKVRLLFQAS